MNAIVFILQIGEYKCNVFMWTMSHLGICDNENIWWKTKKGYEKIALKLVYFEEFQRIDEAFYREKQVQGWSRKKKEALINGIIDELKKMAECMNETHYQNRWFRLRSITEFEHTLADLRWLICAGWAESKPEAQEMLWKTK